MYVIVSELVFVKQLKQSIKWVYYDKKISELMEISILSIE